MLRFEITSYPPPLSDPQVMFKNSSLPSKWKVSYKSTDKIPLPSLRNLPHFIIELTTDLFLHEDSGVYSVTVRNNCSSSIKNVIVRGK